MRVVSLLLFTLAGCVSQSTLDEVIAERDALTGQVGELKDRVAKLEGERNRAQRDLEKARSENEAARAAANARKLSEARAAMGLGEGQKLSAVLHTTLGDVSCELWPEVAPVTVANFVQLSEGTKEWTDPRTGKPRTDPLYNGTIFHRVIAGFMVQGGDPLGSGRGGPGYRFEDEVSPDVRFDQPGLLAMANSGPATNGSQFFITDSKPAHLNGKHTIFGKCEMPVVQKIIGTPTGPGDRPKVDVVLQRIAIVRS